MRNENNVNTEEKVMEVEATVEVAEVENKNFKDKAKAFWKKNSKTIGIVAGVASVATAIGLVIITILKADGEEEVIECLNEGELDSEDIIDIEPMEVVDVE